MKTYPPTLIIAAACCLAALSTTACSKKATMAEVTPPAAKPPAAKVALTPPVEPKVAVAPPVTEPSQPTFAAVAAPPVGPGAATAVWADIRDNTFDKREAFFAGLDRLEARVDGQLGELAAKRAVMVGSGTSTQAWDFAMKEMASARVYLKGMGEELRKASRETWDQQKDKVGQAWTRTQEAYGKVQASTTT